MRAEGAATTVVEDMTARDGERGAGAKTTSAGHMVTRGPARSRWSACPRRARRPARRFTGVDTAPVNSRLRRSAATVRLLIVLLKRHDDAASLESVRCLDVAILPKLGDTRELQETLQRMLSAAPPRSPHRSVAPLIDRFCDDEWLARFRES